MGFSQTETVSFSRRSSLMGASIFLVDLVLLVLFSWGALCAPNPWLQMASAVGVGVVIALLFIVGHDAGHESLTPHRWLNGVIGRLALLPSLHTLSLWKLVHNQTHHRWTNLSPEDYVWTPLSRTEFETLPKRKQLIYRFNRSIAGPVTYYFFEFWIKRIIFPSRKEVRGEYKAVYIADIFLVLAFAIGYLFFLVNGGMHSVFQDVPNVLNALFFGFVVPFAVWNFLMGFVIYLHHTHPGIRWFNDKTRWRAEARQSQSSVHIIFPGPINFIFHWIMEHNAHHERPSIPLYNLRAAQAKLVDQTEDHLVMKWNPFTHYDVVQRCKLYDFEAERWLNFAGEYTSEPLGPKQAPASHFRSTATRPSAKSQNSENRS